MTICRNARLYDLLKELSSKIDAEENRRTKINVTRASTLDGTRRALRRSAFNPAVPVSVRFADDFNQSEGAVDEGGPMRELFRLLLKEVRDLPIFDGEENNRNISLNAAGLLVFLAIELFQLIDTAPYRNVCHNQTYMS